MRYAIDHPAVRAVTTIGLRKLGVSPPKLKKLLNSDFGDCSALAGQDAAVRLSR